MNSARRRLLAAYSVAVVQPALPVRRIRCVCNATDNLSIYDPVESVDPSLLDILCDLFPVQERWRLLAVLMVSIGVAFFEMLGVASIMPFMAVLMDPDAFDRYAVLRSIAEATRLSDRRSQTIWLGVAVGVVILVSNVLSAAALWTQQSAASRVRVRLSRFLFQGFLFQPYQFHLRNDGPSLVKILFNDIDSVVRLTLAALQFSSRLLVVIGLVVLLVLQNPTVAIWTMLVMGGCYALIYRFVRARVTKLGRESSESYVERARIAQESLAGVRELTVLGREHNAVSRFWQAAVTLSNSISTSTLLSAMPKFILEPIAFGGILVVALLSLIAGDGGTPAVVPTLALYAFVGFRLLPAMQQVYTAVGDIRFTVPAVMALHHHYALAASANVHEPSSAPMVRVGADRAVIIRLEGIEFTYPESPVPALRDVSLAITRGASVGFVGRSGSGKTTLVDLILGLLTPAAGRIITPDGDLDAFVVREWRRRIGYVAQHVFLANATVLENIAFGMKSSDINRAAAERASRLAQAHDFIARLPLGYDTVIGERGVTLSGGQRQRLGIARALYGDPEVLIFDEATSALDGLTESAVMDAIHALKGDRTVILIAHRLKTIEACDKIVVLERGEIRDVGTYDELTANSAAFQALITMPPRDPALPTAELPDAVTLASLSEPAR